MLGIILGNLLVISSDARCNPLIPVGRAGVEPATNGLKGNDLYRPSFSGLFLCARIINDLGEVEPQIRWSRDPGKAAFFCARLHRNYTDAVVDAAHRDLTAEPSPLSLNTSPMSPSSSAHSPPVSSRMMAAAYGAGPGRDGRRLEVDEPRTVTDSLMTAGSASCGARCTGRSRGRSSGNQGLHNHRQGGARVAVRRVGWRAGQGAMAG
jgi:hypothetical protein